MTPRTNKEHIFSDLCTDGANITSGEVLKKVEAFKAMNEYSVAMRNLFWEFLCESGIVKLPEESGAVFDGFRDWFLKRIVDDINEKLSHDS